MVIGVLSQRERALLKPGRILEVGLREAQGVASYSRVRVFERCGQGRHHELPAGLFTQGAKGAESLDSSGGFGGFESEAREPGDGPGRSRAGKRLVGEVTDPAIGACRSGRQAGGIFSREGAQRRKRPRVSGRGHHPVESPHPVARADLQLLEVALVEILRVLDDTSVHVCYPEPAVRPRPDHRRAEPVVARGQELRALFAAGPARAEGYPSRLEDDSVDEVVDGLADKGVAVEARSEQVVPVDREAVGGGEVVGSMLVIEARHQPAAGIDPARVWSDGRDGPGRDRVRISPDVGVREDEVKHGTGVLAAEPVPPVITGR